MTDKDIEIIVNKLIDCKLSGYYISKQTEITETTISNYRQKKTIPTKANAKILEYFFKELEGNNSKNQSIIGDNNTMAGNNLNTNDNINQIISELREQIRSKDKTIDNLMNQINKLMDQIERLTEKI